MELHLVIEGTRDLAAQIHRQLREAIQSGRLAGGTQLPPSRLLAEQLGVSRKTVSAAYEKLALDRLIVTQVGAGSFVASRVPRQAKFVGIEALGGRAIAQQWQGMETPMLHPSVESRARYEFVGGATSARLFPQVEWRQCILHALRRITDARGYYAEAEGLPALRDAISRHVGFSRGVDCTLEDVVVTNGAQQALDLVARVLIEPGCAVVVEEPGYLLASMLLEAQGANVVSVPVDAEGLMVDLIPEGTRLIYTTPAHQFPLGMPMSLARRMALLVRAEELGAIIVEDDYDSEFRYDTHALASLKSLDRAGLVAYVNSFSKVLSPDLRLGYVVAPPALRLALLNAKHLSDRHNPLLMQWALARFIAEGHLLKHVRRCHAVYSERRTRLLARLEGDLAPWLEPLPANAGFHIAALFKRSVDVQHLCHLARRVEVGLYSLDEFHRTPGRPGLLMGFGAIEAEDIDPALDRVREVLEQIAV
ncbi:PLP-dependent aminotransferase family protein [Lysobacter sp. A6]|uniref:PLP-dependent aminotransferase family protein n=1 Tax=Noviluteimonas lactosilytica TaxID=2888523 RepID=A0ABS8JDF8_9GAMM|nr:PLP-dependent aminotransferase family protein [Lysobacter lactosilyticus]MCC8361640.1 PLP-dependent aminotransferase family protein [Lysobacter lactosilyticus]